MASASRPRQRTQSQSSVGSSVAPARLQSTRPSQQYRAQRGLAHETNEWFQTAHSQHQHQHQHQHQRRGSQLADEVVDVGSVNGTSGAASGGLEAWLRSQAKAGPPTTSSLAHHDAMNSSTTQQQQQQQQQQQHFPSFAPSGRVQRSTNTDAVSESGRSQGGRSAGGDRQGSRGRSNGARLRNNLPAFDLGSMPLDGNDAMGKYGGRQHHEGLASTAVDTLREENDDDDALRHFSTELKPRSSRTGLSSSFSAGGYAPRREGPRARKSSRAPEPSLDTLVASRSWVSGGPGASSGPMSQIGGMVPSSSFAASMSTINNREQRSHSTELKTPKSLQRRHGDEEEISATPLRRFIRWLMLIDDQDLHRGHQGSSGVGIGVGGSSTVWTVAVLASVLVKWAVGLSSWSGKGVEPLHGDFEAQRHWIEITLHLPRSQWYFYDLQYWGLDYPPLTAIVSQWCGQIATLVPGLAPSFALDSSRGDESPLLVTYLRTTVLALDLLAYTPAILFFLSRKLQGRGRRTRAIATFTLILQPSLILIDHGHFQYNAVMLGLAAMSFSLLYTSLPNPDIASSSKTTALALVDLKNRTRSLSKRVSYEYIAAAVSFSLSLCFKQMALYYAPAVFAIMLGRCWGLATLGFERGLICLFGIGLATIITFGTVFRSWITDTKQLGQVIHRIFPLARGIFEDKVANLWCFVSVLPLPAHYKLKNAIEASTLAKVSLATVLVVILLPCVHLFAAGAETAKIEMSLNEDAQKLKAASERRMAFASTTAGSTTARRRKDGRGKRRAMSNAAPSEVGSEIASVLSGGGGAGGHDPDKSSSDFVLANGSVMGNDIFTKPVASSTPSPAACVLPYALLSVSLAFFLFGFQTHEKSILLPLLPLSLLISAKGDRWGAGAGKEDFEWAMLGNNVGAFSMFPLLQRDGLTSQYFTLVCLWNWIVGHRPLQGLYGSRKSFVAWFGAGVHIAMLSLHLLELVVMPTLLRYPTTSSPIVRLLQRYPDLFAVLNVLVAFPAYFTLWLWSMKRQVEVGFANGLSIFGVL